MDGWNTTFLLGRPIFRGYVSFREGSSINCTLIFFEYEYENLRGPPLSNAMFLPKAIDKALIMPTVYSLSMALFLRRGRCKGDANYG